MELQKRITEIKLSLIRVQIQTLSTSLSPNPGWRDYGPKNGEDITERVVDNALQKCTIILLFMLVLCDYFQNILVVRAKPDFYGDLYYLGPRGHSMTLFTSRPCDSVECWYCNRERSAG